MSESGALGELRAAVRGLRPNIAFVFGSGLGAIARRVRPSVLVPFAELSELEATTVDGHDGEIRVGEWAGRMVLAFSGRLHRYEGHAWERVLTPIRWAAEWGIRTLVLTNAAGGIRDDLEPGSLMAIRGHIDWTCPHPWGCTSARSDPQAYAPQLITLLLNASVAMPTPLTTGTYAAVIGPNYETPAEIRGLRALGADAVGMSTAREIEAAARWGLETAAISCITNRAAGLSPTPLTHAEVLENSQKLAGRLADLLECFLSASEPEA